MTDGFDKQLRKRRKLTGAGAAGFARPLTVVFVLLLLAGVGGIWALAARSGTKQTGNVTNQSGSDSASFSHLVVTGELKTDYGLILAPHARPAQPTAGLLYLDDTTKKLTYYDGTKFVTLQGDGVGGVRSLTAEGSGLTITDDGSGNLTLKVTTQAAGSSISTPVSVAQGGTGAVSLASNGVLVGNGTAAITAAVAGSSGLCLLSTAGAPAFAACPGSSGNPFQQGGNSFGATATLGTNDSQSLAVKTNNATQFTIAVGGAATFQNSADSTAAFRVLNSSSMPQLVVDTSNARVYIGNPTGDTTGALLVLDTKTSSGDPTGVDGAMYYNSSLAVMRCYMDGYWRDCANNERTGYTYINDMVADHDSEVAFSGTYYGTASNYDGHPGDVDLHAANNGDLSGMHGSLSVRMGGGTTWRNETDLRTGSLLSNGTDRYVIATGFADTFSGDITAISNGCYFRYSDNVNSGNWQGVCETTGTESVCDTGVAVVGDTWYRLTVAVNSAGSAVTFTVNGSSSCQVTTNIPTGSNTTNFKTLLNKTAGTGDRLVTLDYVSVRAQFDTPR